jgi:hypothetical protein
MMPLKVCSNDEVVLFAPLRRLVTEPRAPSAAPLPAWRDRSGALLGFGWLLVALGALCGLLAVFLLAASLWLPAGRERAPVRPEGAAVYVLIAATFVVLGLGSIRARRWARALIVVVLWLWILTGVGGFLMMAFLLPRAFPGSVGGSAAGALGCVMLFVLSFFALFSIVLPVVLLLFYRREDVRATVESRDPESSWVDRLPESLLAIVLALAFGAGVSILSLFSVKAVPLFGSVLTGAAAVLCLLVTGALSALLAWAVAKKNPLGWWGLVLFQVVTPLNLLTLRQIDMETLLRQMGYPDDQAAAASRLLVFQSPIFVIAAGAAWIGLWVFLFTVRKHFRRETV